MSRRYPFYPTARSLLGPGLLNDGYGPVTLLDSAQAAVDAMEEASNLSEPQTSSCSPATFFRYLILIRVSRQEKEVLTLFESVHH